MYLYVVWFENLIISSLRIRGWHLFFHCIDSIGPNSVFLPTSQTVPPAGKEADRYRVSAYSFLISDCGFKFWYLGFANAGLSNSPVLQVKGWSLICKAHWHISEQALNQEPFTISYWKIVTWYLLFVQTVSSCRLQFLHIFTTSLSFIFYPIKFLFCSSAKKQHKNINKFSSQILKYNFQVTVKYKL